LVERNLAKVEVEGSSPFSRSSFSVRYNALPLPTPRHCNSVVDCG
jgi:hypothetical protein